MKARSKPLLSLIFVALLVSGCSSDRPPEGTATGPPPLTPDTARAALVEFFRSAPEAFEVKFNPAEYAAMPIDDQGEGQYKLGWFRVDLPNRKYHLQLAPAPDSFAACTVDYDGAFEFEGARWVARKPVVTYAKVR